MKTLDPAGTSNRGGTPPRPKRLGSTKIDQRHLERLAIVYVRQSTPQQIVEHRESLARQYALSDYAQALGWSSGRILSASARK